MTTTAEGRPVATVRVHGLMRRLPDKICLACNRPFNRKRYRRGDLECAKAYRLRKHCSRHCGNSKKVVTQGALLWRARQHKKPSCEACGSTKLRTVHHVDQNQENNDPSNLQTLCKRCHDFWHAVGRRLGWAVVGRMPELDWVGRLAT